MERWRKGGISTVVTALIMILISLIAIGVVWAVVSNILKSEGEKVSSGFGQIFINLELQKVEVDDNGDLTINIQRNAGQGDLSKVYFIISDGENTETIQKETNLQELENQNFIILNSEISDLNGVKEVSIAPIIGSSIGNVADTFDNSPVYNLIFENNLISDPLFKKKSYWTSTWVGEFVDLENETQVGVVDSAKVTTTGNIHIYSDFVPIDPYKTYKFTLWIKQSHTDSTLYFGYDAYNSAKVEINSYNVVGTAGNNSYFWYGDVTPSNSWKKMTGYIMSCTTPNGWTKPSDTTQNNFRMDCSTAFLRMRFLNYDGPGYGTGIGTTAWYALPRIEAV